MRSIQKMGIILINIVYKITEEIGLADVKGGTVLSPSIYAEPKVSD
jgi:hypothetical protein